MSKEPLNLTEVLRLRREMAKKSVMEKEKKQEEERRLRQIQMESDRLEKTKKSLEDKLAVSCYVAFCIGQSRGFL